jgi:putative peptide zinc metalloprotease protein
VRAWEGGTLLDVLPASAGSALEEGTRGSAVTVWPEDAGALPTEDQPTLALVLTPAGTTGTADGSATDGGNGTGGITGPDGAPAPTWVFPFDRPLPPGDGDNQALAVNTEDGSVLYDVSFALVWADGDTALNRNEAYALASCSGCTTVAVAFQVVLLVGSVDVVVPQNIAAAVNYACLDCVTVALATQLVVSLDGPLDGDGQRALEVIWGELQELGRAVPTMPLAELRDRLDEYEARIVEIVRANGEPATTVDGAEATGTAEPGSDDPGASAESSDAAPTTDAGGGTTEGPGVDEEPADSSSGATSSGAAPTTSAPATSATPTAAATSEAVAGSVAAESTTSG